MKNSNTYNEMMVHIPLCTHKDPQDILILSDDKDGVQIETNRHYGMNFTVMAPSKATASISDAADDSFDIVIFDMPVVVDTAFLAHLNRVTTHEALVVIKMENFMGDIETSRALMEALGEYFKIVMPYSFDASENGKEKATLMLASKFYHPTADFILHRTDLIDGLSYYNCDVHPSSFAQPNYLRTALKGVARN